MVLHCGTPRGKALKEDSMPTLKILACALFLLVTSFGAALADPPEAEVQYIPFTGPASEAGAELSGLARHRERLIMLPQYPDRVAADESPALYAITMNELKAYIRGEVTVPPSPEPVIFNDGGTASQVPGFQGYEAVAFDGDRAYLTIEARTPDGEMHSWAVSGEMMRGGNTLVVERRTLIEIPQPANIENMGHEALVLGRGELLAIYEASGRKVDPHPKAFRLAPDLAEGESAAFPSVEYRITDATSADEDGVFYAMNYFYPGEKELLDPSGDPLPYGAGRDAKRPVERILKFRATREGAKLEGVALGLKLADAPRNWEGVARLPGMGFLLVTDKFPKTLLGFAPRPLN
jgi:hypothetical protein